MSGENKFCVKCGANLPEGSAFCPECGASVGNNDNASRAEYTAAPTYNEKKDLGAIPLLIRIYGVVAVLGSIMILLMGSMTDSLVEMIKIAAEQGAIDPSEAEIAITFLTSLSISFFAMISIPLLLSGIFAIISSIYAYKLDKWRNAVTFCGIAALLPVMFFLLFPVMSLILTAVGLLMTYMLYQDRSQFIS